MLLDSRLRISGIGLSWRSARPDESTLSRINYCGKCRKEFGARVTHSRRSRMPLSIPLVRRHDELARQRVSEAFGSELQWIGHEED